MTTPLDIDAALLTTDADLPTIRRILATRVLAALTGRTYPTTVLADNPLVYWRLGEASGTAVSDSSPNNINGTYGTVTLGVPGLLVGDPDTAVSVPAGGPEALTSNEAFAGLGTNAPNSTWEFWIKSSDTTAGDVILLNAPSASGSKPTFRYNPGTDAFLAEFEDGPTSLGPDGLQGDLAGTATLNLNDGNPHHVVVRVDSTTTLSIWLDGVSKTVTYTFQVPLDAPTAPDAPLSVWSTWIYTPDELAVYDHRLSDAQIAAHYLAGTTRATATVDDLVTDAGAITTLRDQITDAKSLIDSLAQIAP